MLILYSARRLIRTVSEQAFSYLVNHGQNIVVLELKTGRLVGHGNKYVRLAQQFINLEIPVLVF